MATRANLYVDQGTDFYIALEIFTEDNEEYKILGTPNLYCAVSRLYSTNVLFEPEVNVIEDDAIINNIEIIITPEQTKNLKPGKYTYDVLMELEDGVVRKILEGLIFIQSTITKVPQNVSI